MAKITQMEIESDIFLVGFWCRQSAIFCESEVLPLSFWGSIFEGCFSIRSVCSDMECYLLSFYYHCLYLT